MPDAAQQRKFQWVRGLVAAMLSIALGLTAVELLSPERRFGSGEAAAEVSVRVVPRLAPSAEAIRRRVMTNENLREVAARLRGPSDDDAEADETVEAATFDRWRRQLAVEIHPTQDPQRRRIRFLAAVQGNVPEATALVETVAVQYAESLTAERWYGSIDRLRSAEAAADTTFEQVLELLRNGRTAGVIRSARPVVAPPAVPAGLPAIDAVPLSTSSRDLDRELFRLMQQRATLLENLQPAHPQIVALDARLNSLQLLGAGIHIRRTAGESGPDFTLPDFADAPAATSVPSTAALPPPPTGLSTTAADAVQQWQQSRVAVKASLDELLAPAAAEFPVVSTAISGLQLWEHRAFWRLLVSMIGLLMGVAFLVPWRSTKVNEPVAASASAPPVPKRHEPSETRISTVAAVPKAGVPSSVTNVPPPTPVQDERILTVEQAAAATGGPVLGVLVRRRDSTQAVA